MSIRVSDADVNYKENAIEHSASELTLHVFGERRLSPPVRWMKLAPGEDK